MRPRDTSTFTQGHRVYSRFLPDSHHLHAHLPNQYAPCVTNLPQPPPPRACSLCKPSQVAPLPPPAPRPPRPGPALFCTRTVLPRLLLNPSASGVPSWATLSPLKLHCPKLWHPHPPFPRAVWTSGPSAPLSGSGWNHFMLWT